MLGIRCVEDFIGNCSSPEQRNRFHFTASGALQSSRQLCRENTQLRNGENQSNKQVTTILVRLIISQCYLEYLSHSSCFREIALSDVACASQYNDIMDQMINVTDDNIEDAQKTLSKICWYVDTGGGGGGSLFYERWKL